jgi:hypothetical protein
MEIDQSTENGPQYHGEAEQRRDDYRIQRPLCRRHHFKENYHDEGIYSAATKTLKCPANDSMGIRVGTQEDITSVQLNHSLRGRTSAREDGKNEHGEQQHGLAPERVAEFG